MKKAIRIKMAEAEGWTELRIKSAFYPLPTYDNHDDLQRIIDGMDAGQLWAYGNSLFRLQGNGHEYQNLKATVEQKQSAIIKAMGWEEVK